MESTYQKKEYYEILRILACALVIFNHTTGFSLYQKTEGIKQIIYIFLATFTKINVPLFIMISGALLLKKSEDISVTLRKRVLRFVILLVAVQALLFFTYKMRAVYYGNEFEFTLKRFVLGILNCELPGCRPYWYLYAYLGFLLVLPFMQRVAHGMKKTEFTVILCCHMLIVAIIPIIDLFSNSLGYGHVVLYERFVIPFAGLKMFFLPLAGYYIDHYIDITKLKKKHLFGITVLGLGGMTISCLCTYYEGITIGQFTENYLSRFMFINAGAVFLWIKYLVCEKLLPLFCAKIKKVLVSVGALTFGIYLLDPFLKVFLYKPYATIVKNYIPNIFVSIGWVLTSIILGGICTYLLKKIPGVAKYI